VDIDQVRKNIRYAMSLREITLRKAAADAGFTERMLHMFLSGKCDLTVTKFLNLCEAIGISADKMITLGAK